MKLSRWDLAIIVFSVTLFILPATWRTCTKSRFNSSFPSLLDLQIRLISLSLWCWTTIFWIFSSKILCVLSWKVRCWHYQNCLWWSININADILPRKTSKFLNDWLGIGYPVFPSAPLSVALLFQSCPQFGVFSGTFKVQLRSLCWTGWKP